MKLDLRSKAFLALSVLGIPVAIYHGYSELTYDFRVCNINNFISCQSVFASGYTQVLGIPFYIFGLVWFPSCIIIGLVVIKRYGTPNRSILVPFLMIGNIFTLYPWYLEISVIGAYCPVCITMYVINYVNTGIAWFSPVYEEEAEPEVTEPEESEVGGGLDSSGRGTAPSA